MANIVPLISSSSAGPLGILHLPRLWLKIRLHAVGALPEGYRHGNGGFDELTCENLGIDVAAFVSYVETEQPSYAECERWVSEHATKLDAASIARHNLMIRTRAKPEERAAQERAALGIDDPTLVNAIALNDLDDWAGAHAMLASLRSEVAAR
jgi:hypothetical protein